MNRNAQSHLIIILDAISQKENEENCRKSIRNEAEEDAWEELPREQQYPLSPRSVSRMKRKCFISGNYLMNLYLV